MEHQEAFFTESKQKIRQYLNDRLLLIQLRSVEKIARLSSAAFAVLLVGMVCFFIMMSLSIMAGYFFTRLTHNLYIGFGIIAAFYLIVLFIILKTRRFILDRFVINTVIRIIFDKMDGKPKAHAN